MCISFVHTGVFCQTFFSTPIQKCPGDDITFTCVVMDTSGVGVTTWSVTIPAGESSTCDVRHNLQRTEICGPNGEFSSSDAVENGDNYTSTLSVSDDFNGTTVVCLDQALSKVGSENICTVGEIICFSNSLLKAPYGSVHIHNVVLDLLHVHVHVCVHVMYMYTCT